MKEGSVIKAAFVQADGEVKYRPAVLLKKIPPFEDYLICAISSQTRHYVAGLDLEINNIHKDFNQSGLKVPGIVRTGMITMVPSEIIVGAIGELSSDTYSLIILKNPPPMAVVVS